MEMKNKPKTSQFAPKNNQQTGHNQYYELVTKEDIYANPLEINHHHEQVDKAVNRIMTPWNRFLDQLCDNNMRRNGPANA